MKKAKIFMELSAAIAASCFLLSVSGCTPAVGTPAAGSNTLLDFSAFDISPVSINVGDSANLVVHIEPSQGVTYEATGDEKADVTVNSNGTITVTGKSHGSATVNVTAKKSGYNAKTVDVTITIGFVDFSQNIIVLEHDAATGKSKPHELYFNATTEDAIFSWYECASKNLEDAQLIDDASEKTYSIPPSTESGIKYYICEANLYGQKKREVFPVAYTKLPVVHIDTEGAADIVDRENWINANMRLTASGLGTNFENLEIETEIKGRGNSSWTMPKKSYSLKLKSKEKVLGMKKHKRWVLLANYADKTLFRNDFASYLGNEIFNKEYNPSFEPVDLVLNGKYLGTYLLGEQIKIDDNRVKIADISDYDAGKIALENGGFILEIDFRHDAEFWFDTTKGVPVTLKDPDTVSVKIQQRVKEIVQAAEDAIYGENFRDTQTGYAKYIDVDSFVDWFLINELSKNLDAIFGTSVYIYYNPADCKLHMGPNWDFDRGFGQCDIKGADRSSWVYGNYGYNNLYDTDKYWIKNAAWIHRLFEDEAFEQKVKTRWREKRGDLQSTVENQIRKYADKISVSAEANFLLWDILGKYTWPSVPGFENRTTHMSEVEYMIDWIKSRMAWLDSEWQ